MKHSSTKVFTLQSTFPPNTEFEEEEEELPVNNRQCRDTLFIFLFVAFLSYLSYIIIEVIFVKHSNPNLLIHGYDNFGNICGQQNIALPNVSKSGEDKSNNPYLLIESIQNSSLRTRCVTQCPEKGFYVIAFYRCLPLDSRLPLLIDAYNITRTFVEEVLSDLSLCWKELTYLCSISFVLALVILILLRFLANIIIWITLFVLSVAAISGSVYIWLIWSYYKSQLLSAAVDNQEKIENEKLVEQWLIAGITSSILALIFLLIVAVMRKRIKLVAILFKEAGKAISDMPFLLLQPFWTFCILFFISFVWLYGLIYIQSTRYPFIDGKTGFVFYKLDSFYKYMKWYHMFAYLWVVHFVFSCQHFVIAGSVSYWFFKRSKREINCPLLKATGLLIRYHLGSIALGSLLVASLKLLRLLIKRVDSLLNRYQHSCDRAMKCCRCCLWCFEKFVVYINQNAYIEIAIYGDSFCVGAQKAFNLLSRNALRVLALNSVGDFLLFLAKMCVVSATVLIGIELIHDKSHLLHFYWAPIITAALFAYFVSHCFLSVYEMAIDTLFLCFVEDCHRNDGIRRPFYMSTGLMQFVESSRKAINM